MSSKLISTITPCFRMQRYLPEFLRELPQQTIFNEIEVILDHNEPEPEEVELVRQFQTQHPGVIKHIIHEKVDPIGISMNRCIREASADYVAIWNVDDLRTPGSLESQLNAIRSSDGNICHGPYKVTTAFGAKEGRTVNDTMAPPSEFTRSMMLGPFFMFSKKLCETAGYFDEQLKSGADFDLAIRLAFRGKVVGTSETLGFYLDEGKGASTRPGSLQPIERTVIEFRYGIYDKIDYRFAAHAARYRIPELLLNGRWIPVDSYVPNYAELMSERFAAWHREGVRMFAKAQLRQPFKLAAGLVVKR